MAKDSESRRAWVKNAAIIFLVILLLLTFFSNTILNYSLPEVSAQYASYGTLTTSVKVSGTVKANESYNVVYEASQAEAEGGTIQSRKVVSVFVKEGDTVEKDAPILELQGGASTEQEKTQNEYDALKKEYDLALLDDTVKGLTSDDKLAKLRKELANLEKEYSALLNGEDTSSIKEYIEDEIEELNEQKKLVNDKIIETQGKIEAAKALIKVDIFSTLTTAEKLADAEIEYTDAEAEYNRLTEAVKFYKEQLDAITDSQADISEANALTTQLKTLEDELERLLKQYSRDEEDYLEQVADIVNQVEKLQREIENGSDEDASVSEGVDSIQAKLDQIEALREQLRKLEKDYERSSEDARDEISKIRSQISDIEEKLDIIEMPEVDDVIDYAANYDLAEATEYHKKASAELEEATARYNTAKDNVKSLREQNAAEENLVEFEALLAVYEDELDALEDKLKQKNKELEQYSGSAEQRKPETVAELIADKKTEIAIEEASQAKSDTETKLNREEQKKKLDELAAKIEAYKTAPATTSVTAPIAGRIVSINYVPGDSVSSGNTVASIEVADKGYICEITMASEEARKIQVGAPCSVVNSWWYSNIEASVAQIRSDPQSQGKNRIIIIEVKGDVYEGQSLTFSIGDKSQSYDTVLPNSAIREDNDGQFVLVVDSKNSALGTRYTVRRVNISIVASDDTKSAVSGLYGSEFVVTNSTVPVSDKQRVRLAEN